MLFWGGLVILLSLLTFFDYNTKNAKIGFISFFILTILYSFRYKIGIDYDAYVELFFTTTLDSIYPEPSFIYLVSALNFLNCDYQMLFVVYSTLTFVFIYKGMQYYKSIECRYSIALAALLFMLNPFIFRYSFSDIRQFLATSIFFWGTKYIITREFKKYFIVIICASFIHYSAVLLLLMYWFLCKNFSKRFYIIIVVVSVIVAVGSFHYIVINEAVDKISRFGRYLVVENADLAFNSGTTLMFDFFIFCVMLQLKKSKLNIILQNSMFLYIIISILFSSFSSALRMRMYFLVFEILFLQNIIIYLRYKLKPSWVSFLIFIPLFILYFHEISVTESSYIDNAIVNQSMNNINYDVNFKLFKD